MRCFFGFHKWGKWEIVTSTFQKTMGGVVYGKLFQKQEQVRECTICGLLQTRDI